MQIFLIQLGLLIRFITPVLSYCDDPSPAFPVPNLDAYPDELEAVKNRLSKIINNLGSEERFNATSFSLEVTSRTSTLISIHHTADVRSKVFPGTVTVDNGSFYRIASMTKPFTVLAILQQHAAGNLHLDDPVTRYLSALDGPQNGSIPWHRITIRALASQISGIPRDMSGGDLVTYAHLLIKYGLPFQPASSIPQCDAIVNYTRRCTAQDLTDWAKTLRPVFAPNQQSTYSNVNYNLLSLVVENVTGQRYVDYVRSNILDPLGMHTSAFDTPPESRVVIPAGMEQMWNFDLGIEQATGGLYSCTGDLSKFMRYALLHHNSLTPAVNWFQPSSWSTNLRSFYGMPWEFFRTNSYLPHSTRPITLVSKGGDLDGYSSSMFMVPEYGLGISVLVAGDRQAKDLIQDAAVPIMVRYADDIAQKTLAARYAGTYNASEPSGLNTSMSLVQSLDHGLVVDRFISNGTDVLQGLLDTSKPLTA